MRRERLIEERCASKKGAQCKDLKNSQPVCISENVKVSSKNTKIYEKIISLTAAAAKSLQLCLTLCDPVDDCPPGCPVPGILQARTLEWVAISLSNAWKWKVKVKSLSRVRLLATSWTAAYQAPPSMGFARQEYSTSPKKLRKHKVWIIKIWWKIKQLTQK